MMVGTVTNHRDERAVAVEEQALPLNLGRSDTGLAELERRGAQLTRFYRRVVGHVSSAAAHPGLIEADDTFVETQPSRLFGRMSFLLCVVVPAMLVTLYLTVIATNQYVAEMRLVVRMGIQDRPTGTGLAGAIASATGGGQSGSSNGSGTSVENAYVLTNYVNSRSIVDDLLKNIDLRALYTRPEADFYARLKHDATREEIHDYWLRMLSTFVDANSGIVTVEVRAFRPDDALTILRAIQSLSETLLNEISVRARQDAIRRATEEVTRARTQMLSAIGDMERFRNAEGIIDPVQKATETGKLLTKVQADLLSAENQLAVARSATGAESPTVKVLVPRVDALRAQVADLRAQLTSKGGEARSVASALARYEDVAIKQKMAETLYVVATNGLEKARANAEAQSVYLTVFVPPALPEDYTYPKRWQLSFLIAMTFAVFWGIGALVNASVDDHRLA